MTPKNMHHRYWREEYLGFLFLAATARLVGAPPKVFDAFTTMMELSSPTPFEKCGRDLPGFTVEDLARFGGNPGKYDEGLPNLTNFLAQMGV